MHDHILDILVNKDDVSWQSILYELVKTEKMDPWDVDVSMLAQEYIKVLGGLKKHDFRISGKVILAAAILLKMQSTKLISDEIEEFDRLIAGDFATEQEFYDSLTGNEAGDQIVYDAEIPELMPRTPMPRNRKVSIYDLVKALQKALEVKRRRIFHSAPPDIHMPEKKRDITLVIKDMYGKIVEYFTTSEEIARNPLLMSRLMGESPSREDMIYTILPLLHLSCERKIDLHQENKFGEIEILYPGTKRMEDIKSDEEKKYKEWLAQEIEKERKHKDRLKKLRQTLKQKKEEQETQHETNEPKQEQTDNASKPTRRKQENNEQAEIEESENNVLSDNADNELKEDINDKLGEQ